MEKKICVIGLGYVGLPLAVELSKHYDTTGYDISNHRIHALANNHDETKEVTTEQLKEADVFYTNYPSDINDCNIYIVTVPTPVTKQNTPDLTPLIEVSRMLANRLNSGDIVIYESTVYPGVTEEVCVPILEESKLKFNQTFFVGYSPERINPGDKVNTLTNIKKVTSGSDEKTAKIVDDLYSSIITAGTHLAPSIKVAEAAKVIENTQRDVNIAFMNELAKIFDRLDIDTNDVLDAAKTKWNFLPYQPGLVGGHCIGVDPYYLAQKAQEVGYHPEVILSGRRTNSTMAEYVASDIVKKANKSNVNGKKLLLLGATFKENCPDLRNSQVFKLYDELVDYNYDVTVVDPQVTTQNVDGMPIFGMEEVKYHEYDIVVLAVSHDEFKCVDVDIPNLKAAGIDVPMIYDIKGFLNPNIVDFRL